MDFCRGILGAASPDGLLAPDGVVHPQAPVSGEGPCTRFRLGLENPSLQEDATTQEVATTRALYKVSLRSFSESDAVRVASPRRRLYRTQGCITATCFPPSR